MGKWYDELCSLIAKMSRELEQLRDVLDAVSGNDFHAQTTVAHQISHKATALEALTKFKQKCDAMTGNVRMVPR